MKGSFGDSDDYLGYFRMKSESHPGFDFSHCTNFSLSCHLSVVTCIIDYNLGLNSGPPIHLVFYRCLIYWTLPLN